MNRRSERVKSIIQEELAKIIEREIEFEDGVLATITNVFVDEKLERAHVKVGILPPAQAAQTFQLLKKAQGRLHYLLMKKMNIKPMPKIEFELDYGSEHAARVEKLLLESENKGG